MVDLYETSLIVDDPDIALLVTTFKASLPARTAALRDAHQRAAWLELANLAHQMAGAADGYGFSVLGIKADAIEAQARYMPGEASLGAAIKGFAIACDLVMGKGPLL